MDKHNSHQRRPVGEGLFVGSLDALKDLRLAGMACQSCHITSFSITTLCPNCGDSDLRQCALSRDGTIITYSILRHRPPGNYKGPAIFEPFAMALVGLADGIAVVAPLTLPVDAIEVGLAVQLAPHVLYEDDDGVEVVAFQFCAAEGAG